MSGEGSVHTHTHCTRWRFYFGGIYRRNVSINLQLHVACVTLGVRGIVSLARNLVGVPFFLPTRSRSDSCVRSHCTPRQNGTCLRWRCGSGTRWISHLNCIAEHMFVWAIVYGWGGARGGEATKSPMETIRDFKRVVLWCTGARRAFLKLVHSRSAEIFTATRHAVTHTHTHGSG